MNYSKTLVRMLESGLITVRRPWQGFWCVVKATIKVLESGKIIC